MIVRIYFLWLGFLDPSGNTSYLALDAPYYSEKACNNVNNYVLTKLAPKYPNLKLGICMTIDEWDNGPIPYDPRFDERRFTKEEIAHADRTLRQEQDSQEENSEGEGRRTYRPSHSRAGAGARKQRPTLATGKGEN